MILSRGSKSQILVSFGGRAGMGPCSLPLLGKAGTIPLPLPHFPPISRNELGKLSMASGAQLLPQGCAQQARVGFLPQHQGGTKIFLNTSSGQRAFPLKYPPSAKVPLSLFFFFPQLRGCRDGTDHERTPSYLRLPRRTAAGWGKISVIILQGATGTHTSERRASEKQYVYPPAVSSHLFRQQAAL